MKPEDRLETRVAKALIQQDLKDEILNKLDWYRQALYTSKRENERLEKALSDERWKTAICTGSY